MSILATKNVGNAPPLQRTNVLYLVLHGLISLIDIGKNGFQAHLLDMQNEHRYKFGNWLSEKDIPARGTGQPPQASLTNVDPGDAVLDPTKDAIIVLQSVPTSDSAVRAVIELPRPRRILYFRSGNIRPNFLSGTQVIGSPALQMIPTQLTQVRIFEYVFQDPTKLSLDFGGGASWQSPTLAFADNLAVAALHVFDEPDAPLPLGSDHNQREFNVSTTFLGSPQLKLTSGQATSFALDPDVPSGLLMEEIFSLAERENAIFSLVLDARVQQFGRATALAINRPPGSGLCASAHALVK